MNLAGKLIPAPAVAPEEAIRLIEAGIALDLAQMEDALALATIISTDRMFQEALRPPATTGPFAVHLRNGDTWIEVGPQRTAGLLRDKPNGMPIVRLTDLLKNDPRLKSELVAADSRTRASATAARLLHAFLSPTRLPDRRAASDILPWSAAIETLAYSVTARALAMLDLMRPAILSSAHLADKPSRTFRRRYWMYLTLMARTTLIASDVGARRWLDEMSHSFIWQHWTPTRPLVRERNLWLVAIAGRSAAAFGAGCVERYVERLGGVRHPIDVLDCLIGLVSIALTDDRAREEIGTLISSSRSTAASRGLPYPELAVAAHDQAIRMIRDPDTAALAAKRLFLPEGRSHGALGASRILRSDPAGCEENGNFFGLSILPIATTFPREDFLPRLIQKSGPSMGIGDLDIGRSLNDAWVGESVTPTLH